MSGSSMTDEYVNRRVEGFHSVIASDIRLLNENNESADISLKSGLYRLVYEPEKNWELVTIYDYEGVMFRLYHGLRYDIVNKDSTVYFFTGSGHDEILMELLKKVLNLY